MTIFAEITNPLITLLPPLLVIPFIILFGERYRNYRELSIFIAGTCLLTINIALYQNFIAGESIRSQQLVLFDGLLLYLQAEPLGVLFALLASFLWIVTTLYSVGYMRGHHETNQTRFYVCFALAIAAVMAAAYAGNLLTLFVAYEVITLSTYPLVTHAGTEKAKRAGRIYLGVLMGGSIALLMPAIIVIWWLTGSLDFVSGGVFGNLVSEGTLSPLVVTLLLVLIVFGTGKAAVMPFHAWLPNAMVAPTPVSALLHAVAVVKTGVFLIVKVVVYIFGFDLIDQTGAADFLLVVAAVTILLASFIAMTKDNLKERLAYSTIGQLSYIVLAALIANKVAIEGAGLHIVTHAFGKITLFFCAGAIMVALHKKAISEFDGIGKKMPYTMAAFMIAALSIIGLPPLAGVWSKLLIAEGAIDAGQLWLVAVLMLSALLNIAYLLPIPFRAFFKTEKVINGEVVQSGIQEAPVPCLLAIGITAVGCVVLFFTPNTVQQLLSLIK
ncbi:MAG: multicomponent Na+:H+ antiporter subunit D [Cellvibrionaceae bacterium]|jgi:multicomponent Na+:H+ antiporter subunit D